MDLKILNKSMNHTKTTVRKLDNNILEMKILISKLKEVWYFKITSESSSTKLILIDEFVEI